MCKGQKLVIATDVIAGQLYGAAENLWVVPRSGPVTLQGAASVLTPSGGCAAAFFGPNPAVPVDAFGPGDLPLTFPVQAPLRVAPLPDQP